MKIIKSLNKIPVFKKKTTIVIGVFDGVHKGHQELIRRALQCAKKNKGKSILITFAEKTY